MTWTNPLEPAPPLPTEPAPPAPINPPLPKEAPPLPEGKFGEIPDIDPDLAYLLPATQRVGGDGQNASFNARTGKFQQTDGTNYAFDHLDEYNRTKRMAGKYFDVDNWEKNLREENAKRKRDEAMGITSDNNNNSNNHNNNKPIKPGNNYSNFPPKPCTRSLIMLVLIDIPSLYLHKIQPLGPLDCAALTTNSAAILPVLILFSPSVSPPGSS